MTFLHSVGLPEILAAFMMLALNAYVLTGGADFGGGVWDVLASGPRKAEQRSLISHSIGPIWEANHVWLILVVVVLFTAFPLAYATLGTVLHLPLSIMLIGIVFRGSSFVFRSYGPQHDAVQRRWGRVFSIASIVTPIVLGMIVGALSSGAVGNAAMRSSRTHETVSFASVYLDPWFAPFPFVIGLFALALFALLAAVYLGLASHHERLRTDFRVRALAAQAAVAITGTTALVLARTHAPMMGDGLLGGPAMTLLGGGAFAAAATVGALWTRHWLIARIAAAAQVSAVLWGWVTAQYPYIIPSVYTLRDVASPPATLRLLLYALIGGAVLLLPSLVFLFRTFMASAPSTAQESGR